MLADRKSPIARRIVFVLSLCAAAVAVRVVGSTTRPAAPPAPPAVGEKALDFTLDTPDGKPVKLSDLTAQGPVALVVLRGWPGYQCPICTRQVADLLTHAKDFQSGGARIVLVYPGPADDLKAHAEEFIRGKALPDFVYFLIDPEYKFTNAYNLRWNQVAETVYPSTFVLDRKGTVQFAKISHTHAGRATTEEILSAIAQAR